MTDLIVEDGTGVQDADAYASLSFVSAYWAARTNNALAAPWAAFDAGIQNGSIREATAYLDAIYGPFYRGIRKGYVQGLLWPRSKALDETQKFDLPDFPPQLAVAVAELAARAGSASLTPDFDQSAVVSSETKTVGPLTKSTTYAKVDAGLLSKKIYGVVDGIMAPLVTNSSGGASLNGWDWA